MERNSAPEAFQAQGAILNAFAVAEGQPNCDFAKLLDEEHLRSLPAAFRGDRPIPAEEAEAKHFRFHARRHMASALGWAARKPFPAEVDEALYERWPSADRVGYKPPEDETGEEEEHE